MDGRRFDHWIRTFSLAQTRRQAMRTMAAGVAGGLLGALGWRRDVAAICRADGTQCTTSGECCSGLCETQGKKKKSRKGKKKGKKPKKFCAATPANAQGALSR